MYHPVVTLPGEQAQADWGHLGFISDNGKRQRLCAFSFVLSYSLIRYVQSTTRQDTLTFFRCLQDTLEYTGGVPQIILLDNANTVISERVEAVIQFNRDLMWLVFNMDSNRMLAECMTLNPREK
ncbi:MAG: transposase [Firmicutes bacterium]|nr:transposase [Bacillota bacterium]